jgi:hypothetical protein
MRMEVHMPDASEILFTWNEERLVAGAVVEIEDDTLRDGLQASFIRLIGSQAFATCTGTHSAAVLGGEAPAAEVVQERGAAMRVPRAAPGGVLCWRETSVTVGTAHERTLVGSRCWYPDYTAVPVIDSSARRLGACLLAGSPDEVLAARDVVDLIEPEIVAKA